MLNNAGQDRPEYPTPQTPGPTMVLCPYCGSLSHDLKVCTTCGGHFDLLSRQRSQNAMGPWFIRDQNKPFQPGCSYATLVRLAHAGRIKPETVLRGPSTRQFWTFARNTPGLANLLGACHACHAVVAKTATTCPSCAANFVIEADRQVLGLSPVHLLPGEADPETIARAIGGAPAAKPTPIPQPKPVPTPPTASPVVPSKAQPPQPVESRGTASTEPSRGLSPLVLAVGFLIIMMIGAGAWAWSYLQRPAESAQASTQKTPAQPPIQSPAQASPPTDDTTEQAPEPVPDTPVVEGSTPVSPVPVPEPESMSKSEPEPGPVDQPPANTSDVDRVLAGIAEGQFEDDTEFQQAIAGLSERDRQRLTLLRQRRQNHLRLGR